MKKTGFPFVRLDDSSRTAPLYRQNHATLRLSARELARPTAVRFELPDNTDPQRISDEDASSPAARYGVEAATQSAYAARPLACGALVLGYAAVNAKQIKAGVRRLAQALSA